MSPSTEPFDEVKYKALMDGLECSEIMLSAIKSSNSSVRLDSHFYEKKYVRLKSKLCSIPHWRLRDIVSKSIQTGHTPSMSNQAYYGGNINFIKTDNLRSNRIVGPFTDTLSESGNAVIARTSLQPLDILTTIIGATEEVIARTALVTQEDLPANINQNIVQIRIDPEIASPEYISIFLNTDYGRNYMRYLSRQTEQVNLNCSEVEDIVVPKFSATFQSSIENLVQKAYTVKRQAIDQYKGAETLLLSALNYHPIVQTQSYSEKSFFASFGVAGRLDAEYYQPKFDKLFQWLSALSTKRLKKIVNITKSIEPGSEYYGSVGIPFIRVSDVSVTGIEEPSIRIPKTTVPSIENLYPKKDTILFSKDGSVGIAYKVEDNMEAVTSGALLHLTVKDTTEILPDYLTLLLNSDIVKLQAERDASGAIIQHWKPSDIERVVVPVLPLKMQQKIAEKVEESFSLRCQSNQLLENAKQTVEMAIEQGEDKAMRWLQEQGEI